MELVIVFTHYFTQDEVNQILTTITWFEQVRMFFIVDRLISVSPCVYIFIQNA